MSPPYPTFPGGVGWLESRDDNKEWMLQTSNFNGSGTGFNRTSFASQQMFLNDLRFSTAKSIRTSTIILASFNIIAAFATTLGILCDSYFRKRRDDTSFRFWRNGFTFVPEADVYPMVLSVGIFIQSFIFAGVQSTGLDSFFGVGCTWIAQLMLPAVFIAPYTQLVFGVEIAIRALRKKPFAPRGKYNVSICLSTVGMLLLANFLIADFDPSPNFCLSSLFWFVAHYSVLCFGLLVAITSIVLGSALTLFVRLYRSIKIEVTARVAASRMVYYLALAAISDSFMIPFFFVQGFRNDRRQSGNALDLAMIASVAANVSGLMTGGLYFFLKSSTMSTIGPRDKVGEYENRRARYKITRQYSNDSDNSDDDNYDRHIMNPVTGPRSLRRVKREEILMGTEKQEEALDSRAPLRSRGQTRDSVRSNKLVSAVASVLLPKAPEPARISSTSAGTHARKRPYSLFPRGAVASKASMLLPATTYSPADSLKPPPSMANLADIRHRRDSSLVSSATVQIGLRLSSVDDMLSLAQTKPAADDSVVHTLDCPNVPDNPGMRSPKRAGTIAVRSATRPAPTASTAPTQPAEKTDNNGQREPVQDARIGRLPAFPKTDSQVPSIEAAKEKGEFTLSPKIYSPSSPNKAKLPSPQGVGFGVPPGSKLPGGRSRSNSNSPPRSPPRRRDTGNTTSPLPTVAKSDWI